MTVSILGQMVTKKGYAMQFVHIAKTKSQSAMPKVAAFLRKIECKKFPMAVLNAMTIEQKMQVRKRHEQQGIKHAVKHTSAEATIAALEAQLRINSQTMEGDLKQKKGETPEEAAWGRNRENPVVIFQALHGKCKEPS